MTARLIFLEADDDAIVRRFSETRRPHPLGTDKSITRSIQSEREQLASDSCHGGPDHQYFQVYRPPVARVYR